MFRKLFKLTSQRERDERFLNEATDRYDLEWRMRQLDRRHSAFR